MTDKKLTEPVGNSNRLTDNKIIKALECCGKATHCKNCPMNIEHTARCIGTVQRNALGLIKRQQAKIERLQYLLDEEEKKYTICAKHFYKEAIKEFAERLKHSFFDNGYESPDVDFDYFVDNLVKEMVGE